MSERSDFEAWRATEAQVSTFIARTNLVPVVVLDGVIGELCEFFQNDAHVDTLYEQLRAPDVVGYIAGRSALCRQHNEQFRVLLGEEDPRPAYYAFVRHWVAGVLKNRFPSMYAKLPSDFSTGAPLPKMREIA